MLFYKGMDFCVPASLPPSDFVQTFPCNFTSRVLIASEFRSFPPNSVDLEKSTDFPLISLLLRQIHRIFTKLAIYTI